MKAESNVGLNAGSSIPKSYANSANDLLFPSDQYKRDLFCSYVTFYNSSLNKFDSS